MEPKILSGTRIGLFGKGGSGKSTVAVFLARALSDAGYSVLVLDADSTNHGLAAALGADHEPVALLEYFGGMVFSGGAVTCPVDDPSPLIGADVWMEDLPHRFVGRALDGISLLVAGKLGPLGPGAGCDGPVAKIARDLIVSGFGLDPVTLVDFKAGFEDAARGALTTVDWALVTVDPTTASLRVARHLAGMVAEIRSGVPPATRHLASPVAVEMAQRLYRDAAIQGVLPVLSRVPSPTTEHYLRMTLENSGLPAVAVFPDDPAVAEQWLYGAPLTSSRLRDAAQLLATRLEGTAREARDRGLPLVHA